MSIFGQPIVKVIALHGRRLRSILRSPPRVSFDVVQSEPDLLCLCALLHWNFRFLPYGRSSCGQQNVYFEHNERVRETAQFMTTNNILCDYHHVEAEFLIGKGVVTLYPKMSWLWFSYLQNHYSSFYPDMLFSFTNLAHHLVDVVPHSNLAWSITFTERVALVSVDLYLELCTKCKMCILINGPTISSIGWVKSLERY